MKRESRSYDLLWLCLALFPLLALAFLIPLTPHDYWWYLRLGRDVLHSGAVPTTDSYSFTHFGQTVFNEKWLAGVVFWLVYSAGGLPLTFALRGLVVTLTYGGLWGLLRFNGAGPRLASLLILLAGLAGSNNWSFRPQLLVYPLFVFALWILSEWDQKPSARIWLLPVIALVWANLHGSFLLLFFLIGLALLFGRGDRKTLALVLVVTALVTLLNPAGLGLWRVVTQAFASQSLSPGPEWSPPVNLGWQMNLFFGSMLAMIPLAAFSTRKLSRLQWVWLLSLTWLALSGLRYVIWDLFLLVVCAAFWLADWDRLRLDPPLSSAPRPLLNLSMAFIFLLLPLGTLPGLRESWWPSAPAPLSAETPVKATAWLAEHPSLPGRLWTDLVFASYTIYALPERPVNMDTRLEIVYTAADFDAYTQVANAEAGWQARLDQQGVNLLLLSKVEQPALIKAIEASDPWCEQYRDSQAVIFARCVPLP